MNKISGSFTVMFENPFWIGILENEYGKKYQVSKVIFGPEPTDVQLYEFIQKNFFSITFGELTLKKSSKEKEIGYKRMQKKIKKEQCNKTIGTKAQNALKFQHDFNKTEKKKLSKQKKLQQDKEKFNLKQYKKKEKHKGH